MPAPRKRRSEGRIHSAPAIHKRKRGPTALDFQGGGNEDALRAARQLVGDYAAGLEGEREA